MDNDLAISISSMRYSPVGSPLIENLTIDVPSNQIVSLLGPSGIGKTTLLRMIAGLERRFAGEVRLGGQPITGATRDIQLVFQDYRLLPWKTVYQNVFFATKKDDPEAADRVEQWIKFVGLASKRDAWPKTLSGGEAGRVAFARAFVDQPKALLLDEPFSGLDLLTRSALQDELLRALQRQPATVILVSHSIEDAVLLSDRVYCLSQSPLRLQHEFEIEIPRSERRLDENLAKICTRIREVLLANGKSATMHADEPRQKAEIRGFVEEVSSTRGDAG